MADVLIQERRDLRLREEDIVKTEAEIEIMCHKLRDTWSH